MKVISQTILLFFVSFFFFKKSSLTLEEGWLCAEPMFTNLAVSGLFPTKKHC